MTGEAPVVQIGGITKQAMDTAADAIVRVATCSPVPEVAVKALQVLMHLGETSGVSISHSTISGGGAAFGVTPPVVGSGYRFEDER